MTETTATRPARSLFAPHAGPRREVQALRAIAVSAVVLYHLWPHALPGGYTGVDIFFVISGFLITAHLVREADRTGRINLPEFWARRARRLLPASLLVLVASGVATVLVAPQSVWLQYFREIGASALYFLNWLLAGDSVDYLAAENSASPVQHYWSLSAEEQFYLVWPLLVVLAYFIGAKFAKGKSHRVLAITLGAVTAASLAYSIVLTIVDPSPAYFITPTRAWEFGLGGLLALLPAQLAAGGRLRHLSPREANAPGVIAAIVSWLGVAALLTTIFVFTTQTPFPGYAALLPALGTAAVIWAGTPSARFAPTAFFSFRPVQWIGDISYSLYLWHWPLIVLVPFAIGRDLEWFEMFYLLAVSILLGWLTKILVEDTTRTAKFFTARKARYTLGLTAIAMTVIIVGTSVGSNLLSEKFTGAIEETEDIVAAQPSCLGAAAFEVGAPDPCINKLLTGRILPDIAAGERDGVIPPGMTCRTPLRGTNIHACEFGVSAEAATLEVAVIGDSHAEHWVPAIDSLADKRGWHVVSYLKGGCPFSSVMRADAASRGKNSCVTWNKKIMKLLVENPVDLVITSQSSGHAFVKESGETDIEAAARGLVKTWTAVEQKTGARVVAIRDNPDMTYLSSECLAGLGADFVERASECSDPQSEVLLDDAQVVAGEEMDVPVIDLTRYFCRDDRCFSVIGSVIVYRDRSHIGGTYSRSLAPYIGAELETVLSEIG